MAAAQAVFIPMNFEQQLAALGKDRKRVLEKLKKIFPYQGFDSDKNHEWEVGCRLHDAWTRAACWEFDTLFNAKINHNHWLGVWFQSYVGGIEDPLGTLNWEWVEDSFNIRYESISKPEIARETAEKAIAYHQHIRAQQKVIEEKGIIYWQENKDRLFPKRN